MFIDRYKLPNDEGYENEDGIWFETAEDFMCDILGFCGCGLPEEAFAYIAGVMELLKNRSDMNRNMLLDEMGTSKECQENEKKLKDYFKSQGEEYFMWYYLDDKEFTEHGVGVPGWPTDKGEEVLADLQDLAVEG